MNKEAIYIGRRLTTKNKLAFFWLFLEDGFEKESAYSKQLAPAIIGEKFLLTSNETGAIWSSGKDRPKSIGSELDSRHIEWSAKDIASKAEYDRDKAMKGLGRNNREFDKAIDRLKLMCDSLKYHEDRAAFIGKVTSELWRR